MTMAMQINYSGQTADCTLNVVRTGMDQTPLVVFVRAIGLDLTYWGPQIEALGPYYDVLAYDLRGHGRSFSPGNRI
jgi:3-oxoadipate enol-lactonase